MLNVHDFLEQLQINEDQNIGLSTTSNGYGRQSIAGYGVIESESNGRNPLVDERSSIKNNQTRIPGGVLKITPSDENH